MAQPATADARGGAAVGNYSDRKTDHKKHTGKKVWPWIVGLLALIAIIALAWWLISSMNQTNTTATPVEQTPAVTPVEPVGEAGPVGRVEPRGAALLGVAA